MKTLISGLLLAETAAFVWLLGHYEDASLLTVWTLAGATIGTHVLWRKAWR